MNILQWTLVIFSILWFCLSTIFFIYAKAKKLPIQRRILTISILSGIASAFLLTVILRMFGTQPLLTIFGAFLGGAIIAFCSYWVTLFSHRKSKSVLESLFRQR